MNKEDREYFDRQVDWVMARLPARIHELLEEVPLCVEDRPSRRLMKEMQIDHPAELCGCFLGLAIDERNEFHAVMPNQILLFRLGLTEMAVDAEGRLDEEELREQIRITIIHELAHYHGMDEEEVDEWGYG